MKFLKTNVNRVVSVAEFHNPMTVAVGKHGLRTSATAVSAVVKQKSGIGILPLLQHFQRFFLQIVKICLLNIIQDHSFGII